MTDIIIPIIAVLAIFGLYWLAQNIDALPDIKKSQAQVDRIQAETRKAEIELEQQKLNLQLGELALEAQRLNQIEHTPPEPTEAEYKILDKPKTLNKHRKQEQSTPHTTLINKPEQSHTTVFRGTKNWVYWIPSGQYWDTS